MNNIRHLLSWLHGFSYLAGACVFLVPGAGSAEPIEYGLNLDVGVIHSDNIFLGNDGMEESDVVYTIAPELYLTSDTERLVANIRYRPEGLFFQEYDDANDVYHVLDASLTGTLARDRLFLFLSASNFQTIVTPESQFPTTNIPITANRVDSRVFEIKPYFTQRIGSADLYVDGSYRSVEYDDDSESYQSNDERSGLFRLNNVRREQGMTWGLEYQYRNMEYEISTPWEFQRASAQLGFWAGRSTRLFVTGGAETAFDNLYESNLDEDFWEAGFQYKNQRVDIEMAAGERSYGNSFRADISYTFRRGDLVINYSDGPASRGDLVFDRHPIVTDDNLDNILDRPGDSDRFIRERGDIVASFDLPKSEITFRIFAEYRSLRTTADGDPLEDEEYSGAAFRWDWNVGNKSTIGFGADLAQRNDSIADDEFRRYQVEFIYRFTPRLNIRVEFARSDQQGVESSEFDYVENQARLFLRTEF